MRFKLPVMAILIAALAGACSSATPAEPTQDVNAVYTQAAELIATQFAMQQTQTAMAVQPTAQPTATLPAVLTPPTFTVIGTPGTGSAPTPFGSTPIATVIPTLPSGGSGSTANGCNDSQFVSETIPDKTVIAAGKDFTKVWEILNTGTCTWEKGYVFAFLPDDSTPGLQGYDIVFKEGDTTILPQHSQSFILKLKAPDAAGEYLGYWKMKDASGNFFGARVYVDIVVE